MQFYLMVTLLWGIIVFLIVGKEEIEEQLFGTIFVIVLWPIAFILLVMAFLRNWRSRK